MLSTLRLPFFLLALFLFAFVLVFELGIALAWPGLLPPPSGAISTVRPGFGISYLAAVDLVLAYNLTLVTLLMIWPAGTARVQAPLGCLVGLLGLGAGVLLLFLALGALMLMITLLLAIPFGTLAYFAAFVPFPKGEAAATLSTIMAFKLAFAVCLIFAHQGFLKMKTLVLLVLTSLLLTWLTTFLHLIVPGFLASITDAVAALVTSVFLLIWLLFLTLASLPGVLRAARSLLPG